MFVKNRILGVNGGKIQVRPERNELAVRRNRIQADMVVDQASHGGSNVNLSVNTMWNSEYQYMMTGILPADPQYDNPQTLAYFFRDMYLFDNTAGSAVDIQSSFPFSDFELRGLDNEELKPFQEACDRLNIVRLCPQISISYLTDGFFCGSLIFDPVRKQFLDTLIHDALNCQVKYVPFHNVDPEISVRIPGHVSRLMQDGDSYIRRYIESLPDSFRRLMELGNFKLDPIATLFIARKSLTDRSFVSYLHRILPMYLIEKAMFRGTLTEVHKRQRAITHIQVGDDIWTPTSEELSEIVQQFQLAEYDPLGGWVSTRNAVNISDVRQAGDFFKWTEMVDAMVQYKLRALGISEAFLTADATFSNQEQAYSTFLETQNAYRDFLTDNIFYKKIFALIAVTHELYKDPSKAKEVKDPVSFLYNAAGRRNLKIPEVHWHKQLQADREEGMFDMLEKLDDKGFNIPLKTWIAAAGIDIESLIKDSEDDAKFKELLKKADSGEDEDEPDDFEIQSSFPIQSMKSGVFKKPLLSREFDPEIVGRTKTGKKKYLHNQRELRHKSNENIVKAAINARDPNYREFLKKKNIERFGTATIPGAMDLKIKN